MLIKTKKLLLFDPDALAVEYVTGLQYYYYLIGYKDGQKFYIQGYQNEEIARENLDNLSKIYESGKTVVEI